MAENLGKRLAAETLGTAFLLAAVVGSGIMGERLGGGNPAIVLLVNTMATGAALVALIYTFGPVSGAHLNPVVTLALASRFRFGFREVPGYLLAQTFGAVLGLLQSTACSVSLFSPGRNILEQGCPNS
jgi:glycerol uptake facilitator-like aquaporin